MGAANRLQLNAACGAAHKSQRRVDQLASQPLLIFIFQYKRRLYIALWMLIMC